MDHHDRNKRMKAADGQAIAVNHGSGAAHLAAYHESPDAATNTIRVAGRGVNGYVSGFSHRAMEE
jgi:hypothetical protein